MLKKVCNRITNQVMQIKFCSMTACWVRWRKQSLLSFVFSCSSSNSCL